MKQKAPLTLKDLLRYRNYLGPASRSIADHFILHKRQWHPDVAWVLSHSIEPDCKFRPMNIKQRNRLVEVDQFLKFQRLLLQIELERRTERGEL